MSKWKGEKVGRPGQEDSFVVFSGRQRDIGVSTHPVASVATGSARGVLVPSVRSLCNSGASADGSAKPSSSTFNASILSAYRKTKLFAHTAFSASSIFCFCASSLFALTSLSNAMSLLFRSVALLPLSQPSHTWSRVVLFQAVSSDL